MTEGYRLNLLIVLALCAALAWWFSKGNLAVGILLFLLFTVPNLLWLRWQASKKSDSLEGPKK